MAKLRRMGTMPPGQQYRVALARVALFIGALQQVRRAEPVRAIDDVAGRDSLPSAMRPVAR
jgi:hypothetical protein